LRVETSEESILVPIFSVLRLYFLRHYF